MLDDNHNITPRSGRSISTLSEVEGFGQIVDKIKSPLTAVQSQDSNVYHIATTTPYDLKKYELKALITEVLRLRDAYALSNMGIIDELKVSPQTFYDAVKGRKYPRSPVIRSAIQSFVLKQHAELTKVRKATATELKWRNNPRFRKRRSVRVVQPVKTPLVALKKNGQPYLSEAERNAILRANLAKGRAAQAKKRAQEQRQPTFEAVAEVPRVKRKYTKRNPAVKKAHKIPKAYDGTIITYRDITSTNAYLAIIALLILIDIITNHVKI